MQGWTHVFYECKLIFFNVGLIINLYNFFLTEEIHIRFRKYGINKILRVNHCQFLCLPKCYSLHI